MGLIGAFIKFVIRDKGEDSSPTAQISIGTGSGASKDQPCKPGCFYVYVHKDIKGTVFYVGKGTGDRAYSRDRPPEWDEYVSRSSEGRFSVEIVREDIAEDDAVEIEDAVMAEHAGTIVNRQSMHAPYDRTKLLEYSNSIRAYDDGLKRAHAFAKAGRIDEAITEFEAAYVRYFDVIKNSDYNYGARRGLESTGFHFHPHALADRYTTALAKAGRYTELVAFAERYFRDYGEPSNRTEEALKKRLSKARAKLG